MIVALLRSTIVAGVLSSFWLGHVSANAGVPDATNDIGTANRCEYLADQAPNATFVVYFPSDDKRLICNPARAAEPVLPASTFKIAHALIALETGAVTDEHEREPTDGQQRAIAAWNQPTSLASGMANSTVWFYQRVAERIGVDKERYWLKRLSYGNADMGPDSDLTTFWLSGALRISALEQVDFVDRLRRRQLPATVENQRRVADMLVVDRSATNSSRAWVLHGKTGAVLPIGRNGDVANGKVAEDLLEGLDRVGWCTGWVERPETEGGDAVFALHLPIASQDALAKRVPLTLQMLEHNGVDTTAGE